MLICALQRYFQLQSFAILLLTLNASASNLKLLQQGLSFQMTRYVAENWKPPFFCFFLLCMMPAKIELNKILLGSNVLRVKQSGLTEYPIWPIRPPNVVITNKMKNKSEAHIVAKFSHTASWITADLCEICVGAFVHMKYSLNRLKMVSLF